jgi:hypothetical protein
MIEECAYHRRVLDRVLPTALTAALFLFLQLRSGAGAPALAAVVLAAFAYVTLAGGHLLATAAGERDAGAPLAWTLGLTAGALATYALTSVLPLAAGTALGLLAAVVIVLELAFRSRITSPNRRAGIGFALCIALTAAWCYAPAGAHHVLRTTDVLPVWGDYFIHGANISQFGDARAVGRGSILLADLPPSFYHFASYLPAAALAGLLDLPGLAVASSLWMPLGFLAMTAGAYALGERLAGAAGGVAAAAAVAILPDASNYGLRNGFLSFQWQLFAHPTAMYALGAVFLSLALLERWSHSRSRAVLIGSAALAASVLFLRAHVFVLCLPAWAATGAYCGLRGSRLGLWLVAALGAGAAAANLLLSHWGEGQWRFGGPALGWFLTVAHSGHEPTAYTDFYAMIMLNDPWGYSLLVGIVLAYLAALGALVALLPAAAVLARRRGELRAIDVFPAYVAYCWLLLMLFAPLTWAVQGPELIDRPVVLVYTAAAIWTACLLVRCTAAARTWAVLLGACVLAYPAIWAGAEGMTQPKFHSGRLHLDLRTEPGLVEAADYLRREARIGDIFAVAGLKHELSVVDLAVKVCSLSGVPAYLARPHLETIKDAPRKALADARFAALEELEQQSAHEDAFARLRRMGVKWYLVTQPPRWDPARSRAAFSAGTVSLYAVPGI